MWVHELTVRTVHGNSGNFEVKVGMMHQGSALSPLLFVIVIEAVSTAFQAVAYLGFR